jgi:hypothetical protein
MNVETVNRKGKLISFSQACYFDNSLFHIELSYFSTIFLYYYYYYYYINILIIIFSYIKGDKT